jgi:hypothetical protein
MDLSLVQQLALFQKPALFSVAMDQTTDGHITDSDPVVAAINAARLTGSASLHVQCSLYGDADLGALKAFLKLHEIAKGELMGLKMGDDRDAFRFDVWCTEHPIGKIRLEEAKRKNPVKFFRDASRIIPPEEVCEEQIFAIKDVLERLLRFERVHVESLAEPHSLTYQEIETTLLSCMMEDSPECHAFKIESDEHFPAPCHTVNFTPEMFAQVRRMK